MFSFINTHITLRTLFFPIHNQNRTFCTRSNMPTRQKLNYTFSSFTITTFLICFYNKWRNGIQMNLSRINSTWFSLRKYRLSTQSWTWSWSNVSIIQWNHILKTIILRQLNSRYAPFIGIKITLIRYLYTYFVIIEVISSNIIATFFCT